MKKLSILAFACLMLVFLFSLRTEAAKYYKYVDEDGKVHFVDNMSKIPREVRDKIEIEELKSGRVDTIPERWYIYADNMRDIEDVSYMRLLLYSSHQSRLAYWLLGEILAIVVFLVCLYVARDFPTLSERRRFGVASVLVFIIWLALSLPLGFRPSAMEFCSSARANLMLVRQDPLVPSALKMRARSLEDSLLAVKNKIP